jgi:serine O-acetyltransferase
VPTLSLGTTAALLDYVCRQLDHFFPDGRLADARPALESALPEALQRLARCIDAVRWWPHGEFDHLHSSQYTTFLYFLANTLWRAGSERALCNKLFGLNKALNGIDLFYEIEMPEVFFIGHSVGIVLAKARYGNRLVLYQNSTVGKNHGIAPSLGEGVVLYPNSAVIGRCRIGDGSVIAQGVSVINRDTPGAGTVFQGSAGDLVFKTSTRDVLADIFR